MKSISNLLTTIIMAVLTVVSTVGLIVLPLASAVFVEEASLASWLKTNIARVGSAEAQNGYWLFICLCALTPLLLSIFAKLFKLSLLAKFSLIISTLIIVIAPFFVITVFFRVNLSETKIIAIPLTFLLFLCMQSYSINKSIRNGVL